MQDYRNIKNILMVKTDDMRRIDYIDFSKGC